MSCDKRVRFFLLPIGNVWVQVVIFVDDVNMPVVEEYGAQAPIELLRQFLDFKVSGNCCLAI